MSNLELATALIKEHSERVGVDKQPPATQLWHVLASLVEWCEAQEPSVDIEVELGQVFEFRRQRLTHTEAASPGAATAWGRPGPHTQGIKPWNSCKPATSG